MGLVYAMVFFAPFSLERIRELHLCHVDTYRRMPDTFETLLGGMDHLEVDILDGSGFNQRG